MRILHFVGRRRLPRNPDTGSTGGISRVALELARAQRQIGHDTWVAATAADSWRCDWGGVTLAGLAEPRWVPSVGLAGGMVNLRTHAALIAFCRRELFDVVHGHEYPFLGFVRASLILSHVHNNPFWSEPNPRLWSSQTAEFRALLGSDMRIAVSQFVKRQLRAGTGTVLGPHHKPGPAGGPIHVVPNGVDPQRWAAARWSRERPAVRDTWGVGEGDVVFLYAGAVAPDKGVIHLVRAFLAIGEELPGVHLALAGGAALWANNFDAVPARTSEYERQVRDMLAPWIERRRVHWLGVVATEDMPRVYAAADVLVVPSLQEAFSLVILEALAAGRPVLASAVGGIPEITSERYSLLAPPADASALATGMRRLALEPDLRERLGRAALNAVDSHSWKRSAAILDRVYASANLR